MHNIEKAILIILLFFVTIDSNAQLYKHWGFWLSDTTITKRYKTNSVTGFLCNKQDDVFIQQFNNWQSQDSLNIFCLDKNGKMRWNRYYPDNDSNIEKYNAQSKLYFWNEKLMSLSPAVIGDTAYYFRFREIDMLNGDIKNEWKIKVPYEVEQRANFVASNDGKVFFIGDPLNQPDYNVLIKFDLINLSSSYKQYFAQNNPFYGNVMPNICNVNDSLVAIASTTYNNNYYYTEVQCNVVNKSNLSVYSINSDLSYYP